LFEGGGEPSSVSYAYGWAPGPPPAKSGPVTDISLKQAGYYRTRNNYKYACMNVKRSANGN